MPGTLSPQAQFISIAHHPLRVFANDDLAHPAVEPTSAIVLIHGRWGDAQLGLDTVQTIATRLNLPRLIIAPQLSHGAAGPPDMLQWPDAKWMAAELAEPSGISSFTVLDTIIAMLSNHAQFPAMRHITLAGHSAGAQLLQRYSVFFESAACRLPVSFVIANAGSYLYLDPIRPHHGGFAIPDAAQYPGYDDWKYGLQNRPAFLHGPATNYAQQNITYLLGALDNDPADPGLDKRPAVRPQGESRLARGQNYWRYLTQKFGKALRQQCLIIPQTGHNMAGMFNHPSAAEALFSSKP